MNASATAAAEQIVHELATALTEPQPGECLPCYLDRVMRVAPCDGTLRLARRYRDAVAPRATALEKRMHQSGGCCDCEILLNIYWSKSDAVTPCTGVRRGSTGPCSLWDRVSRVRRYR